MIRRRIAQIMSDDEGFTLIELILAMLILGVIMAPLMTAFVLGLGQTLRSDQELTNSTDAQIASGYFADDVAGAESVTDNESCGGSATVVQFGSDDGNVQVAYTVEADAAAASRLGVPAGSAYRLTRVRCVGGDPPTSLMVARSLATVPSPVCDGGDCPSTTAPPQPREVSLEVVEWSVEGPAAASDDADDVFKFTLTGVRRVSE